MSGVSEKSFTGTPVSGNHNEHKQGGGIGIPMLADRQGNPALCGEVGIVSALRHTGAGGNDVPGGLVFYKNNVSAGVINTPTKAANFTLKRWQVTTSDDPETGSGASGSNFEINAYGDNGTLRDTLFSIPRNGIPGTLTQTSRIKHFGLESFHINPTATHSIAEKTTQFSGAVTVYGSLSSTATSNIVFWHIPVESFTGAGQDTSVLLRIHAIDLVYNAEDSTGPPARLTTITADFSVVTVENGSITVTAKTPTAYSAAGADAETDTAASPGLDHTSTLVLPSTPYDIVNGNGAGTKFIQVFLDITHGANAIVLVTGLRVRYDLYPAA